MKKNNGMKLYKIKKITNTKLFDGLEVHEVQLRDIIYGLYQSKYQHTIELENGKKLEVGGSIIELENNIKDLLK